jgi:hypothetical protein
MSASTQISTSDDAGPAEGAATLPFWATSAAVHAIAAAYFSVYLLIAVTLHSTLGVDNAIENYNAQSLALSYSARNPPLYDWILYFIQLVTGPGRLGFAILNYGSILACVLVLYQVARRAILDPRLQALSVYAYALLWDIGHESHRILTHSNLMIVAVAATVLTLAKLADERTLGRYLWLGFWIAFGLLAKLGFAAFMAALLVAVLVVPRFRAILFDWRVLATAAVALVPVGIFVAAAMLLQHSIVAESGTVLASGSRSGFLARLGGLARALLGYVVPLLPIAVAIFYRPSAEGSEDSTERRDLRWLIGVVLATGIAFALFWALVLGSTQLRPRYFHALLLLFPVGLFALLDRRAWPMRPLNTFLGVALFVTVGIMIEQTLPRLMPSDFLCDSCRLSIPYDSLGREVEKRFGGAPTLVALNVAYAGRLRAAVPDARVVTLSKTSYRPPARGTKPCVLVWLDESAALATVAAAADVAADTIETVEIPWFQPLLGEPRLSRFNLAVLPQSSALCL